MCVYRNLPDDGDDDGSVLDYRVRVCSRSAPSQLQHSGARLSSSAALWKTECLFSICTIATPTLRYQTQFVGWSLEDHTHHRNSNTPVPDLVRRLLSGRLSRYLGFPVRQRGSSPTGADSNWTHDRRQRRGRPAANDSAKGSERFRSTEVDRPTDLFRGSVAELGRITRRQNSVLTNKLVGELREEPADRRRQLCRTHRQT